MNITSQNFWLQIPNEFLESRKSFVLRCDSKLSNSYVIAPEVQSIAQAYRR